MKSLTQATDLGKGWIINWSRQFTGMQDRYKNDIYEGDILMSKNYKKEYYDKVEYRDNGFYTVGINHKSVNILAAKNF